MTEAAGPAEGCLDGEAPFVGEDAGRFTAPVTNTRGSSAATTAIKATATRVRRIIVLMTALLWLRRLGAVEC